MAISNAFQIRITELAEECEVNKSNLPKMIGVDYRSLSNALNYGIIPTPRILIRIANYFNVSIKYLLGYSDDDYFNRAKIQSDFKTRFDSLCKENNVTYYKVSKDVHFDQCYITRWLNKNYLPSLELLELISDYFKVSIDYLLGRPMIENSFIMEYSEEFKQRFIELISDLDCKKSEIPKLLNIDYNVYIKITEFGTIPKPVVLMRIADHFNVSVEYLLGRTDNLYFFKAETVSTFLERYRALKSENNLTDYAIAQKLHITTSYTTNWKNKKYMPSIINLIELSEAFKVSIDYLLGRTDDKN